MDFTPTDDRRMLTETLDRFLAAEYPVEHRMKIAYDLPCHDAGLWAQLAELGALGALLPEEAGGFGGAGFDVTTVFEALGRTLCPEPVLGALMALRLLQAAGQDATDVLEGTRRMALAVGEADGSPELDDIACTARDEGDGWRLSGRKSVVYGGPAAHAFLVAARNGDALGLWEVDAGAAEVAGYAMIDGGGAAELLLSDTRGRLVMADARAALEDALDWGRLALCAEAVGAMDRAHALTIDYLRTRKQFGRPIGAFQALQHRAVDMGIEIEQARSITIHAAGSMGTPGQSRAVSMAKSLIGRVGRQISEEAVQMHGGIAMTWEAAISHYAKRLVMIDHQLGDTDTHLARVMAAYAA
ncbi:MAG: acyl-CoA dehydrogenase family protein [Rhodobacteraceae bacterium]|nr:acyl-CoA dehydrogenase family protein [Paracoccaceae bacterium]